MPMVCVMSPNCGMPSTVLSCLSIIMNRNIDSLPQDDGEPMTEYMDELIHLFRKLVQAVQQVSKMKRLKISYFLVHLIKLWK